MFNHFASPQYLLLIIPVLLFLYWEIFHKHKAALVFPNISLIKEASGKNRYLADIVSIFLKTVTLLLLVIALSRPQLMTEQKEIYRKGVDIIIALDASGSMAAEDLEINRLAASKKIIQDFIKRRKNDRMGLVIFGAHAITRTPLTFDHDMLANIVSMVDIGDAGDGTAIGQAIVTALNRLRDSEAKSKVIILLTDGENNFGNIGPLDAAKLAADLKVKIYTIGLGNPRGAPIPFIHPRLGKQYYRNPDGSYFLTKLDIKTLTNIAEITSSKFFIAPTAQELQAVFQEIDKLEKVKLETDLQYNYKELFILYLILAIFTALFELILSRTVFRRMPCI